MKSKKVVMITKSSDITGMLKELRKHLEDRGAEVMRFDTDRFPTEAQAGFVQDADGETLYFRTPDQQLRLEPDDTWRAAGRPPPSHAQLRLRVWPGGEDRHLADASFHTGPLAIPH